MKNKTNSSGLSVGTVIQIVLIILKLTNLINWSWYVVLIPLWISAVVLTIEIVLGIIALKKKNNKGTDKHTTSSSSKM